MNMPCSIRQCYSGFKFNQLHQHSTACFEIVFGTSCLGFLESSSWKMRLGGHGCQSVFAELVGACCGTSPITSFPSISRHVLSRTQTHWQPHRARVRARTRFRGEHPSLARCNRATTPCRPRRLSGPSPSGRHHR